MPGRGGRRAVEANKSGMQFVRVPYWWDGKEESLKEIFLFHGTDFTKFKDTPDP